MVTGTLYMSNSEMLMMLMMLMMMLMLMPLMMVVMVVVVGVVVGVCVGMIVMVQQVDFDVFEDSEVCLLILWWLLRVSRTSLFVRHDRLR